MIRPQLPLTPEQQVTRRLGFIGSNPITWLKHQVEQAKDISPETRAHIRQQFNKLRLRHGPLRSLTDEQAEYAYIRLAYRINFMRTQEALFTMKVRDKGYHTVSKTLSIWGAAGLKFKADKDNGRRSNGGKGGRKGAALWQGGKKEHEPEGEESGDA